MTIAYDTVSQDGADSTGPSGSGISHAATSSDNDNIAILAVAADSGDKQITGTPTYGGQNMIKANEVQNAAGKPWCEIWYYFITASELGTQNCDFTLDSSDKWGAFVATFTGVGAVSSIVTAEDTGSPSASGNITSAINDLTFDVVASNGSGTSLAPDGAQTQRGTDQEMGGGGQSNHFMGVSTEPGAATVAMAWTIPESKDWVTVAFNMDAAVAARAERGILRGYARGVGRGI